VPALVPGAVALLRSALFELMSDLPFIPALFDLAAFFSAFFMLDSRVLPTVPDALWSLAMPDWAMPLRGLAEPVAAGLLEVRGVPEASLGLFVPEPAMEPAAAAPVCAWAPLASSSEAATAAVMEIDFKNNFVDMLFPFYP
jgi:hypothetical protein